jgi:hypothetical protein
MRKELTEAPVCDEQARDKIDADYSKTDSSADKRCRIG